MKSARIGCSGWNYADWRGGFYPQREPQRRWLQIYAAHFDTVEVNATFYRLPAAATVRTWSEQTPDDFRFRQRGQRRIHQTPERVHVSACRPWLDAELAVVAPQALVLLGATERGLASYWRTPSVLRTARGRDALGIARGERVLGLLHLGPPEREPAAREREPVETYVEFLD